MNNTKFCQSSLLKSQTTGSLLAPPARPQACKVYDYGSEIGIYLKQINGALRILTLIQKGCG